MIRAQEQTVRGGTGKPSDQIGCYCLQQLCVSKFCGLGGGGVKFHQICLFKGSSPSLITYRYFFMSRCSEEEKASVKIMVTTISCAENVSTGEDLGGPHQNFSSAEALGEAQGFSQAG